MPMPLVDASTDNASQRMWTPATALRPLLEKRKDELVDELMMDHEELNTFRELFALCWLRAELTG